MTAPDWLRVALEVDARDEALATALFAAAGVDGLEIVYPTTPTEARIQVRAYLLPEEAAALALDLSPLRDPRWLPPAPISRADFMGAPDSATLEVPPFAILPPGAAPPPDLLPLYLDAGMGFGAGEHPTTRLCLAALPDVVRPGAPALDVGSGTGALAIGAALLGAAPVHAVDTAADARRATEENAALNGVAVTVLGRDLDAVTATYPAVLANLLGPILTELAEALLARVEPGGRLLLSGILATDAARVAACFPGTRVEATREEDGWAAVIVSR
ncbi:MAG: 50S ribosomal protein L11 methyltransferase [Deltaproteobacteria bacterium]|nr:50S ribosomal protein L11 methyltransferase [Deltaproteobacteria bacterium]